MAQRHWVGGTGSWNGTAGTKWALTNGGAGGQAEPTAADDVFFDSGSGAASKITIDTQLAHCLSFNATGFTGTFQVGAFPLDCNGSFTLGSGMTFTNVGGLNGGLQLNATTGSFNITSNGIAMVWDTVTCGIGVGSDSQTYTLQDDFVGSATTSLQVNDGTFNANNKNVTIQTFSTNSGVANAVIMGSGTWTITGTGTVWNLVNCTLTANTSTIKITNTSNTAITFTNGGATYSTLWFARGASTATNNINGTSTYAVLKSTGTAAHTIAFVAGTTTTLTSAAGWQITGSAGNLITISSKTTATHTISCTSGNVSGDYLDVSHSIATGGATFYAGANSNNNQAIATAGSGWIFTAPPSVRLFFPIRMYLQAINRASTY